jgi:imidazolonepropionase-like amidohydrolase
MIRGPGLDHRLLFLPLLAFLGCSSSSEARQATDTAPPTLYVGATLVVGDGSEPIQNSAFLVENGRFTQVGAADEVEPPEGAVRVNLNGKTVIPALVDLHSHVGYEKVSIGTQAKENYTRENLIDHLERYAYTGHAITVSLGSDPPDDWVWAMRQESESPSFIAARFETVGRGIAWPGTGPIEPARNDTPYAVFTPWMARVAVRELAARSVPFVKIWVEDRNGLQIPGSDEPGVLTPEISHAAIDEAHQLGVRTMAHVKTVPELKDLLRGGIDMFTHPIADAPADAELMAMLQERPDLWYLPVHTPALAGGAGERATGERPEWIDDPLLEAITCPAFLDEWAESFENRPSPSSPTGGVGGENAKRFYEAGVRIALGSHDAGARRVIGWNSHTELESYVNWMGMTPHEAIVAATSAGAEVLQRDDIGSVAPGKSADFVVLDASPLDDIRNTRRISQVVLKGAQVDREGLAAKWAAECRS